MATLIGVDVGTSGTRALAVTADGELVAEATRPHDLLTPRPGWTEQDPRQWWDATPRRCSRRSREATTSSALGLTGQMHGSVFLDAAGEVIRPALLWNDQRTAAECDEITERVGARAAARDRRQPGADRLPGAEDPLARAHTSPTTTRAWRASCCPRTTSA